MRFAAVLFAALTLGTSLLAFDASAKIETYYDLRHECRVGEDANGNTVSPEQSSASCEELNAVGKELTRAGYCFDKTEQEWALCPPAS